MCRPILVLALLVACRGDDPPPSTTTAPSHAEIAAALVPVFAEPEAESLIPDVALMVGGIDVKAVLASKLYEINAPALQGRAKEALDALAKCSLGLERLERITFGYDPFLQDFAVVVDGDGIGVQKSLDCLHAAITAKQEAPWTMGERVGKTVLNLSGGGRVAYVLGDDRLAFVSWDWTKAMDGIVEGTGTSAFTGKLAPVIARVDTTRMLWTAGTFPSDLLRVTALAGAKDFAATLELTDGAALTISLGYASADEANATRTEAQKQFDDLKGAAPSMGVPQGLVDSVRFTADEASVVIALKANDADLRALQAKLGTAMLGL